MLKNIYIRHQKFDVQICFFKECTNMFVQSIKKMFVQYYLGGRMNGMCVVVDVMFFPCPPISPKPLPFH